MAANDYRTLIEKIEDLQTRLEEAEETLDAIRNGEVDALVVSGENGHQIFTLQNAERPYRVLIEAMQEGTVTLSSAGLILYANQRFAEMLKLPLEKVLGVFIHSFIAPVDHQRFHTLITDPNNNRAELNLITFDGILVPVSIAVGTVTTGQEDVPCLVITDLTTQKRREQEIILLQRLQLMVSEAMSLENALRVILHQVAETTGWVYGEAWMRALDGDTLHCVAAWSKDNSVKHRVSSSIPMTINTAWQSKESIWIPDIQREVAGDEVIARLQLKSVFATPILAGHVVIAVIAFFADDVYSMDQHFARIVSTVVAQLGSFIQRKQMEEALVQARGELEVRVRERTAELTTANEALQLEIVERTRIADRISRLQGVITALSAALTPGQVAQVMIERGLDAVGAVGGAVMMLVDKDNEWITLASKTYSAELPRSSAPAMAAVLTSQQPAWTPSGAGIEALLPLALNERIIGMLALKLPDAQISDDDQHFIFTLSQACAQALGRARLYEGEAQARLEAEIANTMKLRFLAMISHELRTPLTSIKGFASTLLATDVDWTADDQRHFMMIVNEEADKLGDLIEQLLDLSQLQAGMLKIAPQMHTILQVIDEAWVHLASVVHSHQFTTHVAPDLKPLLVDKTRIVQVIANLVENAAKYSPPASHIDLHVYQESGNIRCDVIDEGAGIPVGARLEVFEAFQQLKDGKKGIGLGLAICKGLVEAHGGRIWIDDAPRQGTKVSFTLPAHIA